MAVALRLQRHGRKKIPYYWIIAVDGRKKRDGDYLERIGSYNPLAVPAEIEIDAERALYWLDNGAQPSDTVHAILKYKGVMYRKHLLRGVKKGVLTQEQADAKWQEHLAAKQSQVMERLRKVADQQKHDREKVVKAEAARKQAMLEKRAKKLEEAAKAATAERAEASEEAVEAGPKTIDDVAREAAIERGEVTAVVEEAKTEAPAAEEPAPVEPPAEETKVEDAAPESPEEPKA
jgi:small subunit ribosomal protein S16